MGESVQPRTYTENNDRIVEFSKVHAKLGNTTILNDIDLCVPRGERLVLIGPSGSGKSTMLRLIGGLMHANSGTVSLFGRALSGNAKELREARQRIGFIFQNFNLYAMKSVIENVTLAPRLLTSRSKDEIRQEAIEVLTRFGCASLIDRYPFELSGGQKQRVAIARSLLMRPEILVLDEPTAALDPELVRDALDFLVDVLDKGTTVICATHELSFARRLADRVIFMEAGKIAAEGPPALLIDNPPSGRIKEFLNASQRA